jgi:pimeloyl-ACP methyl ester carboxylesterase
MKTRIQLLLLAIFVLLSSFAIPEARSSESDVMDEDSIKIILPSAPEYPGLAEDTIWIPNNRPIYALMVHGYSQNYHFDHLLCYNFMKHLMKEGAYVHYAWWNNLCAPYMERALHQTNSEPGNFITDAFGFIPLPLVGGTFDGKAVPEEDYQFQADAKVFLRSIRDNNPSAIIILVGHSMGGGSVARLATETDVLIDIVAPIDPVENRGKPVGRGLTHEYNWTRWRIAHDEFKGYKQYYCSAGYWWETCRECSGYGDTWYGINTLPWPHSLDWRCDIFPFVDSPPRRKFGSHVINLFHRYQKEAVFPFDYTADEHFVHTPPEGGSSSQEPAATCWFGSDPDGNTCWIGDGHGEIVGYRGVPPLVFPTGLQALGEWPGRYDDSTRRELLEQLNDNADSTNSWPYRPYNPDLCLVSDDLVALFDSMNRPPVAIAGEDQRVEYHGSSDVLVSLDASASTDPDNDALTYTWEGPFGQLSGQVLEVMLGLGTHEISLTVADPCGHIDRDRCEIHVQLPASVQEDGTLPDQFELYQNHPNPFNASTTISFALPEAAQVRLEVFNIVGQQVGVLFEGPLGPGEHGVSWDFSTVGSGVYFYRLQAGAFVSTRKMMMLK